MNKIGNQRCITYNNLSIQASRCAYKVRSISNEFVIIQREGTDHVEYLAIGDTYPGTTVGFDSYRPFRSEAHYKQEFYLCNSALVPSEYVVNNPTKLVTTNGTAAKGVVKKRWGIFCCWRPTPHCNSASDCKGD